MIGSVRSAVLAAALLIVTAAPARGQASDRPTLVVVITVDQLRGDLLDRYGPAFSGAFRRFADRGYRFTGASHLHAGTYTAAGHATLVTGVFPSRSGIVANSWSQKEGAGWRAGVYAVEDPQSSIVGVEGAAGRSPANLMTSGLPDWILEADSDARIVSLSGKDRAAVTMAGKTRGEVYWLMQEIGRFVTSTYYRDDYPDWVREYNETVMPGIVADTLWDTTVPQDRRGLARADEGVPFEGDGVHTTFPHTASAETTWGNPAVYNSWALTQPRMDRAVLGLARSAVRALELGGRGSVDYLSVSLSATDYVGHDYGPLSQEQLDNLVRLDRELGAFLEFLDEQVGSGRWVAALSADHGVVTMPEAQAAEGEGGRRVSPQERQEAMSRALQAAADQVGQDRNRLPEAVAELLEGRGLVAAAYTHAELVGGMPADSFAVLFRNSYYPGRSSGPLSRFGVEIRYDNHDLVSGPQGTTHGSPYWYDRWVPLMLIGAGVRPGVSDARAYTVDLAPTLAGLAGIPAPSDRDGAVIYP